MTERQCGRSANQRKREVVIIRIEVSNADIVEMEFDSLDEFEERICEQMDYGVVTSGGGAGADWMVGYELEVEKVD